MSIFRKSNKKASSRLQINIQGVRDGILMLPHNQYRMVLESSSINFELKSEDEQDAIIETYQNFLNSLASPVQILVRIRELDIQKNLIEFRDSIKHEKEKIYKDQMNHYTEFVEGLIASNKILARQFYIVLSHSDRSKNGFETTQEQLAVNADIVSKGLGRLGIQTRQLDSLEILDLFYSFYNPESAKRQPLTNQTMKLLQESYI